MGLKPHITVDLGELLIDVSEDPTTSEVMDFHSPPNSWRGSFSGIVIDGPGALTGTVKLQVSDSMEDTDEFGTTWRDKQSSGADITIPADGHVTVQTVDWKRLRLVSSSAEANDRRFRIRGIENAM